jgi:hypothetical protein
MATVESHLFLYSQLSHITTDYDMAAFIASDTMATTVTTATVADSNHLSNYDAFILEDSQNNYHDSHDLYDLHGLHDFHSYEIEDSTTD